MKYTYNWFLISNYVELKKLFFTFFKTNTYIIFSKKKKVIKQKKWKIFFKAILREINMEFLDNFYTY